MTIRSAFGEIAGCVIALLTLVAVLASPVLLWMLLDGLRRFCYEWPP